ncbi:hypothetical protein SESBI_28136 [Sesbania bispinosa]|nr:hypothetical protein SESBI_28136 [Sesbania bispinosa]
MNMSIENKKPCNVSEVHYKGVRRRPRGSYVVEIMDLNEKSLVFGWAPLKALRKSLGPMTLLHDSSVTLRPKPTFLPLSRTTTLTKLTIITRVQPSSLPPLMIAMDQNKANHSDNQVESFQPAG